MVQATRTIEARRQMAHEKLERVYEKHGENSPIVRAIETLVLALLVSTPMWLSTGLILADFDCAPDSVSASIDVPDPHGDLY